MNLKKKLAYHYRCLLTHISPKLNTKVVYKAKFGRSLDLENPETLNEKTLWLKFNTYWNNSLVKQCADKYRVRDYIINMGYEDILNELLDVCMIPEEINWEELPEKFVVKMNIGSGFNQIVFDKDNTDRSKLVETINQWLKSAPRYYLGYSEMQYKDVKPVILVEKYLGGPNNELPDDYKFYCINGTCYMTMFCKDRDAHGHGAKYIYMDRKWNMITNGLNDPSIQVDKPRCLEKAMKIAEDLSEPFPFVRVDFYLLEDQIVFGELTFTPAAGMDVDHKLKPFGCDEDIDHIYGRLLKLPIK